MRPITLTPAGTVLPESELVLNPDGSVYHLALRPEQLGDIVLVCGDPGRVAMISEHFDRIDHRVANREFVTHTGMYHNLMVTAMATGIGTDNIDIVLSEMDALVNIDLQKREPRKEHRSLRIVRLGTCGALQPDIPVNSLIVSSYGIGMDNVLHYYANEMTDAEVRILQAFISHMEWPDNLPVPYVAAGDEDLVQLLSGGSHVGITLTASGFYGPQGRQLRAVPSVDGLNDRLISFDHEGMRILNYEMETSALYGLSGLLGHRAATVCAAIANRTRNEYARDHHTTVERMIASVLDRLAG